MQEPTDTLSLFHPVIRQWFEARIGAPTDVQNQSWPKIAMGQHVLITAPTGSGKTLSAFLWAINQLVSGMHPLGTVRVLYISPLKALNNDIQKNLLQPLEELKDYFEVQGLSFPGIKVMTRSGDTPQNERAGMLRRPPEILITTPESLNLLLTSPKSRNMLTGIATVILDEIHALFPNKRGTHLITAVERVTLLAGEFQRIALSATVKPLAAVADFVAGYQLLSPEEGLYKKRDIAIIKALTVKEYAVKVHFPESVKNYQDRDSIWSYLINQFKNIINSNRATLFFCNSRRFSEKIARLINEDEAKPVVYSHHGSLSKEIRLLVEEKLKKGELQSIVATNSLELGIDVGELDHVVLVQSPFAISSAIQKIGRAGHGVGQISSGSIYPLYGRDLVDAIVMSDCIKKQDIEELQPVMAPLDILAQVIISMVIPEEWDIDELYGFIKTVCPYRELSRKQFDLVIAMLAGKYSDTRIRELKPVISIDAIDNTIKAKERARYLIYLSGGTIPDRGQYDLRIKDSKAKIGELDEEFVWERNIGETFVLGNQSWQIVDITHNDVLVIPAGNKNGMFPFWKGEDQNRDFHYSEKIGEFIETLEGLNEHEQNDYLLNNYHLDPGVIEQLLMFLQLQKDITRSVLPHRHHVLIEHFADPLNKSDAKQVIIHTLWGGKINRPIALALKAAWEETYHYKLEIFVNNDAILLMLPHDFDSGKILAMINADNIEKLLKQQLERTGFFGAHFRENAGRALLLPKAGFNKRLPLWLNRLRSKKLLEAVMMFNDFPILLETWRTCLQDEFDLVGAKKILDEVHTGKITLSETITAEASPFSNSILWNQVNTYMYEDDTPRGNRSSGLSSELIHEIIFSKELRPAISTALIEQLQRKLQRIEPGYAPQSVTDLLDWLKERIIIPLQEWSELLNAMERDHDFTIVGNDAVFEKIVLVKLPQSASFALCALESVPFIQLVCQCQAGDLILQPADNAISQEIINEQYEKAFARVNTSELNPASIFQQWLSFYGPVSSEFAREVCGLTVDRFQEIVGQLASEQTIIYDTIRTDSRAPEICDRTNLEVLLRYARKERTPEFRALSLENLQLFLAAYQGICNKGENAEDLKNCLEQLFGYPAGLTHWEEYIFPARLRPYFSNWLDNLLHTTELTWFGCGIKKIAFAFSSDHELFRIPKNKASHNEQSTGDLFPDPLARYTFTDLLKTTNQGLPELLERLAVLLWDGLITCDSMEIIRKGVLIGINPAAKKNAEQSIHVINEPRKRKSFNRWRSERQVDGYWYRFPAVDESYDYLEEQELAKDRARQLLQRYGILFRQLLDRELPLLQWSALFRALRLMELSGEIISGHFFEQVPGVQFMSHEAFRFLQQLQTKDAVYWINAIDPASLCGVKIDALKQHYPARIKSNFLVFRGTEIVITGKKNFNELYINVSPHDPDLHRYFTLFADIFARDYNPPASILVEFINDQPALDSEFAQSLMDLGFTRHYNSLILFRKFK